MAGDGSGSGSAGVRHDDTARNEETRDEDADAGRFDWRGWLLVGVVVLSFVVVPAVIVLRPPQLPFEAAFLALPMVPAVLLGATAVWVAVRGRGG